MDCPGEMIVMEPHFFPVRGGGEELCGEKSNQDNGQRVDSGGYRAIPVMRIPGPAAPGCTYPQHSYFKKI